MPYPVRKQGAKPSGRGGSAGSAGPRGRRPERPSSDGGGRFFRKKVNRFHVVFPENPETLDYKDTERLSKFLTEKGKIVPRRITALTARQQRILVRAIKRSRHAGLLAFQVA